MLKKERQAYILRQVSLHNSVLSADLSTEIQVSEDTIRRDLNELAEEGKVIKVHGGALSKSFNSFYLRSDVFHGEQKQIIGHNTKINGIERYEGVVSRSNFNSDYTDVTPSFDFEKFQKKIENE